MTAIIGTTMVLFTALHALTMWRFPQPALAVQDIVLLVILAGLASHYVTVWVQS